MVGVTVVGSEDQLTELLVGRLRRSAAVGACARVAGPADEEPPADARAVDSPWQGGGVVVYLSLSRSQDGAGPSLDDAGRVFRQCLRAGTKQVVLVSSAAVYRADPHHTGLLLESTAVPSAGAGGGENIAGRWAGLESLAARCFAGGGGASLTVLRPAATLLRGGGDYFSRLFAGRVAAALPGHDPSIQLLGVEDLAEAITRAVEAGRAGVYNVAPAGVIPLRRALRLAGVKRLPVPRVVQRLARPVLSAAGGAVSPVEQLEYIRYSWTVSGEKIRRELGFEPGRSSAEALLDFARGPGGAREADGKEPLEFDDFGMDEGYIAAFGRTMFNFLSRHYWRIETDGIDHVPREGRAVLVGVHRGFMPWDAVMTLHLLGRHAGRYPRFLIHPGLIKFPFLFNFHTKLGGVVACQENADRLLGRGELLGIYPEGIRGAFALYRDAYRLGKFGRDEFVKMALRNRAPIIPFVTVGSAEIFPIIARIEWRWWKRQTEWPFFPLTPTWPLLPVPLPSKWHMQFLPPLHVEELYPPEAADDPAVVRRISLEVRGRMEEAMRDIRGRRRSAFYGSVFGARAGEDAAVESAPAAARQDTC